MKENSAYIEYVEDKKQLGEVPLTIEEWGELNQTASKKPVVKIKKNTKEDLINRINTLQTENSNLTNALTGVIKREFIMKEYYKNLLCLIYLSFHTISKDRFIELLNFAKNLGEEK